MPNKLFNVYMITLFFCLFIVPPISQQIQKHQQPTRKQEKTNKPPKHSTVTHIIFIVCLCDMIHQGLQ